MKCHYINNVVKVIFFLIEDFSEDGTSRDICKQTDVSVYGFDRNRGKFECILFISLILDCLVLKELYCQIS